MKKKGKWLFAVLLAAIFVAGFFLTKADRTVEQSVAIPANQTALFRVLSDSVNWQKWWPGSILKQDGRLIMRYEEQQFHVAQALYNTVQVLTNDSDTIALYLFPQGADTTKLVCHASLNAGDNSFRKIKSFFRSKKLKKTMAAVLTSLKIFASQTKNIYGFDIRQEKVWLEYLVSIKKELPHYPETSDLYQAIGDIKDYIQKKGGKEDGYPITSITPLDSVRYTLHVAVPVKEPLPQEGRFLTKKLLRGGDILVTNIMGGQHTIDAALEAEDQYAENRQMTEVALRFQYLVTDRSKEPDTTKWKTKICYPVLK